MKTKELCCLRHIATAIGEDSLDMFPVSRARLGTVAGRGRSDSGEVLIFVCGQDLIDIHRFGEVVIGAGFDGFQCGRDAAVAGQHDDRRPLSLNSGGVE